MQLAQLVDLLHCVVSLVPPNLFKNRLSSVEKDGNSGEFSPRLVYYYKLTPPKFNMEPENDGFQKNLLFQGLLFGFHVKFLGCRSFYHFPLPQWEDVSTHSCALESSSSRHCFNKGASAFFWLQKRGPNMSTCHT